MRRSQVQALAGACLSVPISFLFAFYMFSTKCSMLVETTRLQGASGTDSYARGIQTPVVLSQDEIRHSHGKSLEWKVRSVQHQII
ncbi:hypothetical protein DER45DRAFT_555072, partial [Fusarium avenaceum]